MYFTVHLEIQQQMSHNSSAEMDQQPKEVDAKVKYDRYIRRFNTTMLSNLRPKNQSFSTKTLYDKLRKGLEAMSKHDTAWKCLSRQEKMRSKNYILDTDRSGREILRYCDGRLAVYDGWLVQTMAAAHQKLSCAPAAPLSKFLGKDTTAFLVLWSKNCL